MNQFQITANNIVEDLQKFVSHVHDHFNQNTKPLNVKVADKVSLPALAQVQVWAQQIGKEIGEDHVSVFNRMKRDHGIPIALADPERAPVIGFILEKTGFHRMNERQQLMLAQAIEITRHFSTKQHNQFRDSVQAHYNAHGFNLDYRGDHGK